MHSYFEDAIFNCLAQQRVAQWVKVFREDAYDI